MRKILLAALVVLLAQAGCSGSGGGGTPADPACGPGGACPTGRVCDPATDTCIVPDDAYWCSLFTCPAGQVCDLTSETGCRAATSCAEVTCGTGLYCDQVGYFCTSTPRCSGGSCPSGYYCDASNICRKPGPGGCLTAADCDAGYTCDLATHLCRGAVACASQAACSSGWTCTDAGWCEKLPAGTCDAANDCGATEGCGAGLCTGCATRGTVCSGNFTSCDAGTNRCVACTSGCALAGDACGSPIPLTIAAGRTVLSVDLGGYACDGGDCAAGLADAYWALTIPSAMIAARLELGVGAGAYDARSPRLEILPVGCGGRIAHHVFTGPADRETMWLAAGTYLLRLVGDPAAAEPYTLSIAATQDGAYGASCSSPQVIQTYTATYVDAGTRVHAAGDACADADWGPERVFAVDLPIRSWLRVTAEPQGGEILGVDVKRACLEEAPYACNATPGATVTQTVRGAAAGRHYIVVHYANPFASFTLSAHDGYWPVNDLCSGATDLGELQSSTTAHGSTADDQSLPDGALACGGTTYGGNDQFFRFHTVFDQDLHVTVTPDAPGTWTPVVAVETACGQVGGMACGVGGPGSAATLAQDLIEPRQYIVHVMSADGAGGPFTLQVSVGTPVYPYRANASCAAPFMAEPLALSGVGASVTTTGDTRGGGEEYHATCGWNGDVGAFAPDLVYQVVLPPAAPRGRVRVTATPLRATFDPALTAQTTCSVGAADLGCWNASGRGAVETGAFPVNGSAFVWVKGAGHEVPYAFNGTEGPFELTATYEAAAPANDVCADAATSTLTMPTLSTPASVTGDLSDATATAGTCGGGLLDAYHRLVVAGSGGPSQAVNVTLTPSGFTGRLRIFLNDCSNCYAATYTGTGPGASVVLPMTLRAGDAWTLGVSSTDGKVGTYTLTAGP